MTQRRLRHGNKKGCRIPAALAFAV